MYEITLPFPPSNNTYYRKFRGIIVLSPKGRLYRAEVSKLIAEDLSLKFGVSMFVFEGVAKVVLDLYPPDKRIRDIDNFQKALFDGFQKSGIVYNDSQFKKLLVRLHCSDKLNPRVEVKILSGDESLNILF